MCDLSQFLVDGSSADMTSSTAFKREKLCVKVDEYRLNDLYEIECDNERYWNERVKQ